MQFTDTLPLIWPLTFLLIALVILKKADAALKPIVTGVVNGVASNATQHALAWAMVAFLSVISGMEALGDVARQFHWVYVEAFCKIVTPMLATAVAALTKPPQSIQADAPKTPVAPTSQ